MSFVVDIKVIPASGKQGCKLDKNGIIVCYLKEAPERNKANNELIAYIAKLTKIAQTDIVIIAGATSRKKRLKLNIAVTQDEFLQMLGIEKQMKLL